MPISVFQPLRQRLIAALLQIPLIPLWLWRLGDTDAYYSIYVLCGVLGLFCLGDNYRTNAAASVRPLRIRIGIAASAFSAAVILANYKLFITLPSHLYLLWTGCVFLGGFVVSDEILLWCLHRCPMRTRTSIPRHPVKRFFLFFGIISLWFLTYWYTTGYPAYLTPDSFKYLEQIQSGNYINNNPFYHTMAVKVLIGLGQGLFHNMNAALGIYSVFQILLLSGCMAYASLTLYQASVPRWYIWAALAVYGFLPYNMAYSITLWKDIWFSASVLLMITALYRSMRGIGGAAALDLALFALGGIGCCLMRTNGLSILLLSLPFFLVVLRKKKPVLLIILLVVLLLGWVLTGPVLDLLQVGSTDFVEGLSLPLQQIGRVITHECPLSQEDTEMLSKIMDIANVPNVFSHEISDPMKGSISAEQRQYLKEHLGEYISLWLRIGIQYPSEYAKAWIELTKGYWNAGYDYWVYYTGGENAQYGIAPAPHTCALTGFYETYFTLFENSVLSQILTGIGLHSWLLAGCLAVNALKKRSEWLLTIPALMVLAELLLGTPVFAEFRYAYPVFLCLPLLLGVTLFRIAPAEKQSNSDSCRSSNAIS